MLSPYTSLQQRLELYEVDAETVAAARKFWYAVRPEFHRITGRFYSHLQGNAETARFLPDERGIDRLRAAQAMHWENLFTGQFDASFVQRVNHAAEAHLRIRLPNYHYMAAYAFFLNELAASAQRLFQDDHERSAIIRAINTLVLVDMDLTMSFYMQHLMQSMSGGAAEAPARAQKNA